jgi:hypothetical protein
MDAKEFFKRFKEIVGLYAHCINNPLDSTNDELEAIYDDLQELLQESDEYHLDN